MARHRPHSFFRSFFLFMYLDSISVHKHAKKRNFNKWAMSSHLDRTSLVNNPYLRLTMLDWLSSDVMVGELPCGQINGIHPLSTKFATGVKIKATGKLKLSDSPRCQQLPAPYKQLTPNRNETNKQTPNRPT